MKFSRTLLTGACAALVSLGVALPGAAQAQTKLRIQSAFPAQGLYQLAAEDFAERVNTLSGGRLKVELLPSGSVVPAFEVLDAVNKKVIDGGYTAPAYWLGKNKAAALFGPAPGGPYGMDVIDYLGWIYDGGGLQLYRDFYQNELKSNVVVFPLTASDRQALGWFKKPVANWADLKGRKCRQTGITAEVFSKSGMATVNMPGGEIVPAGERGVIDCAEFVGAAEDSLIGFQTVWKNFYPQSMHEPATVVELLINGDVWKGLAPDLQAIVQAATVESTLRSIYVRNKKDGQAMQDMRTKHGVTIHRTPDDIVVKTLESWDQISEAEAGKNPFFKKVLESQKAYAGQVVPTRRTTTVPYNLAADHYWPIKKP
ncbi:TRAP transporter substrate-binding protein [Piscinibacter sakaiensis]|uniref:TRAP transporter substrate-binding protein n=1 Tax=Piscinibacter sakaiensis TaxID=1547922 RepID=UPI003AABB685